MSSCEFVYIITTLACSIAKGKTQDEINVLATAFSQLGDTLATILAVDSNCEDDE
jgi:hypothetical protein